MEVAELPAGGEDQRMSVQVECEPGSDEVARLEPYTRLRVLRTCTLDDGSRRSLVVLDRKSVV